VTSIQDRQPASPCRPAVSMMHEPKVVTAAPLVGGLNDDRRHRVRWRDAVLLLQQ
jgi:hypothetical protein